MDDTLAYIDQASFLGFRALGHGPLIQLTWIYDHDVDLEALRRFQRALGRGMLGRRVERSPLPFGRHHWVRWPGPDALDVSADRRPRSEVPDWIEERLRLTIDPEYGPPWHLGVQPLAGGGAAVSLVVSHTVGDGVGITLAVTEAAAGVVRDPGYPAPASRPVTRGLREDLRTVVRAVPEMGRAVAAAGRLARDNRDDVTTSVRKAAPADARGQVVRVPSVAAYVGTADWDERAGQLGGTSNSLFLGVASRLGQLLGRVATDGTVQLAVPVSERTEDDLRGNALTGITVTADPESVTVDLTGVRTAVKRALTTLDDARNQLLAPLPLTPLIPRALARRLEGMALGNDVVIGCSNIGELQPAANRPDGSDAASFAIRSVESRTTRADLHRLGGLLFLMSARVNGLVSVTVSYADASGSNTRGDLVETLQRVLADFGLSGRVE